MGKVKPSKICQADKAKARSCSPVEAFKKLISWENRIEQEVSKVAEQEVGKEKDGVGESSIIGTKCRRQIGGINACDPQHSGRLLFTIYSIKN